MSSNKKSGLKNITLLDIRNVKTVNGTKTKVQFGKGVTLQFEGKDIDLGEYNSLFLKDKSELEKDLEFLVEKEYMTVEAANKEADRIIEKGITHVAKLKLT